MEFGFPWNKSKTDQIHWDQRTCKYITSIPDTKQTSGRKETAELERTPNTNKWVWLTISQIVIKCFTMYIDWDQEKVLKDEIRITYFKTKDAWTKSYHIIEK